MLKYQPGESVQEQNTVRVKKKHMKTVTSYYKFQSKNMTNSKDECVETNTNHPNENKKRLFGACYSKRVSLNHLHLANTQG